MLDTSNWPEVELDVLKDVQLDAKNVRLEVTDAKVEADIIEDLFVNEDALGPVSYTHLRAHETVLDLVCRLLLENKKHTLSSSYRSRPPHT